jgi:hypothetical protein
LETSGITTMTKLFCLFVILFIQKGVYQKPEFKIIIHLDEPANLKDEEVETSESKRGHSRYF